VQSTRWSKAIVCLRECKGQALRVAGEKISGKSDFFTAHLDIRSAISIWVAQRFECRDQLDKNENADYRQTIVP